MSVGRRPRVSLTSLGCKVNQYEMRVTAERNSIASFALPLQDIVQPNGERLLWGVAG